MSKQIGKRARTLLAAILAAVLGLTTLTAIVVAEHKTAYAAADEYEINHFTGLPADWELSPLCDTANVTLSTSSAGDLVVKSTSLLNEPKYYGALIPIAKGNSYADFSFEITFKMTNPADNNRWMGIMFHTQTATSGNLYGYLVNYRYSGGSAGSVVTPALNFLDEEQKLAVSLSDGIYHTLAIVMEGSIVKQYIDGTLYNSWDVTVKNGNLGGSMLTEGGFALIVNRSTVNVQSVRILPRAQTPAKGAELDSTIANTYAQRSNLVAPPTVVCDITNEQVLASLASTATPPSNAILRFGEDGNIHGTDGKNLGSFRNIYEGFNHKIIPVVHLADEKAADAFINFMRTELNILDLAVMSEDASVVSKVRRALPKIRGVVEYSSADSLYPIVKSSTEAGAMTVVLPQSVADSKTVAYLQARFKTVWVRAESDSTADIRDCITGGGYGVVAENFSAVYSVLGSWEQGFVRNIFNVAHRGLPNYNENSLSGIEAAMRSGVTHLELDGHLTKDKHIVVTHDDTIDRTTNGSGTIKDMTLEQIRQYYLNLITPANQERIPTFEEVIALIQRLNSELHTDVVLIFEIKDDQTDFVEHMKAVLDKTDFYANIVIITFENDEHQLDALQEQVPQIPTAWLDAMSVSSLPSQLAALNTRNTGANLILLCYSDELVKALRDRGFTSWFWTYDSETDIRNAAKQGILGVTNNSAGCYGLDTQYIYGEDIELTEEEAATFAAPEIGGKWKMVAVLYTGEEVPMTGTVYDVVQLENGWRIFVKFNTNDRTVYARSVTVTFPVKEEPPVDEPPVENPPVENPPVDNPPVDEPPVETPPAEGTPWWAIAIGVSASMLAIAAIVLVILKLRKKK